MNIAILYFCSRTRWLIPVFKICQSAMASRQPQQQVRYSADSRRKKIVSGKRFRKNSRSKREPRTSAEHPRCRRRVGNRTSVRRSSGWTLGLKSWIRSWRRYEHFSWWQVMVALLFLPQHGSQVHVRVLAELGCLLITMLCDIRSAREKSAYPRCTATIFTSVF